MSSNERERSRAFGQDRPLTPVDRFGVWLSSVAVRRNAAFGGARVGDFGCGFEASFARTQLDHVRTALLVDLALAADLKRHPRVIAIEGSIVDVLPTIESASLDITLCLGARARLGTGTPAAGAPSRHRSQRCRAPQRAVVAR